MTKPLIVYAFLGDGGSFWSGGFEEWMRRLHANSWCDVKVLTDSGRDWRVPVDSAAALPADQPIAGVGYSLGGWGAAWWARYMLLQHPNRRIALVAGVDPAGRLGGALGGLPNPKNWPIGHNVQRCICFTNSLPLLPDSWLFGGGKYLRAADGPQIDYRGSWASHLAIQSDKTVQSYIDAALLNVYKLHAGPTEPPPTS
jgi:hypothetical protein